MKKFIKLYKALIFMKEYTLSTGQIKIDSCYNVVLINLIKFKAKNLLIKKIRFVRYI
jgi:hypothetical protein